MWQVDCDLPICWLKTLWKTSKLLVLQNLEWNLVKFRTSEGAVNGGSLPRPVDDAPTSSASLNGDDLAEWGRFLSEAFPTFPAIFPLSMAISIVLAPQMKEQT